MPTASARPPKRHDVEGFAQRPKRRDRAEHGKRNRRGDDQGRAEAAEKQQDHQAGQRRRDDAFADDAADRGIDEDRLIADRRKHQIARQGFLHLLHFFLDAVDDRKRRHRAVLEHEHQHRAVAVDVNDVLLRRAAVAHLRDVADIDYRAVDGLDRQIAHRLDQRRGVIEIDRVFEGADFLGADRRDQVLRGKRVGDVLAGEAARPHRLGVDVDLHLAEFAAEGVGHRGARHRDDGDAHEVEPEVEQRLLGQALAGKRELNDRNGGSVVVEDQRRHAAGRHLSQQCLRYRRHLRVGGADVGAGLEEYFDDADAGIVVGFDVFDVVDGRGQRALKLRHHAAGHLLGRQPGVGPDRRNDRNSDLGKDVDRRAQRGQRPDDEK